MDENAIWIDLFSLPSNPPGRLFGSASEFIVANQCLRHLVLIDELGQLKGDAAQSWAVSKDFTNYSFELKKGLKFSNGDPLTPKDVVESFTHPDFKKISVHFDFSKIQSITEKDDGLDIKLKEPNYDFIYHLTQPEFGIYCTDDRKTSPKYKITSGPYVMSEFSNGEISLIKNPYFHHDGPENIHLIALGEKKYEELINGNLDIAVLFQSPSKADQEKIKNSGKINTHRTHVGFTYWITINPKSPIFGNTQQRKRFQQTVRDEFGKHFKPDLTWKFAYQLYSSNGPGRLNIEEIEKIWAITDNISTDKFPSGIRGLISSQSLFLKPLEKTLNEVGIHLGTKVDLTHYSDQQDFLEKLKVGNWDFYLINNDFSSYDLKQNLTVTFNKDKPLIVFPSDSESLDLWQEIEKLPPGERRNEYIKELGAGLLREGLIVPLLHKEVPVCTKKYINLSGWSRLFPDFSFWKIKINK